ncbi:MAG: 4'-phosphopantetheinyl transferase family protein [Chitinophagaceae bacterium]
MPLVEHLQYEHDTQMVIWQITEPETYFLETVQPQRVIQHPNQRLQHIAGRFLLTYLQPQFPVNDIQIGINKKPYLPHNSLFFSISHTSAYVAAIISNEVGVGIDVERVSERVLTVQHKFLHTNEAALIQQLEKANFLQQQMATLIWCAKEAIYKWWGSSDLIFKEMIEVFPPSHLQKAGDAKANIYTDKGNFCLALNYLFIDNYCVVWLTETLPQH